MEIFWTKDYLEADMNILIPTTRPTNTEECTNECQEQET